MGYYSHLLDDSLFIFALMNGNELFLKKAIVKSAFDKMLFREEIVIVQMLQILIEGYRINFILNVLNLIEIGIWKNKYLQEIVDSFKNYLEDQYYDNRLLLSSNPLLTIALSAEILKKIAFSRRKFENECLKIQEQLMHLGKMYSMKIDDQRYYDSLIMGLDFRGRSVLKIITENDFEPLMNQGDPKAENLMMSIWNGKESHKCDGNIFGFSSLAFISNSRTKKAIGKKYTFWKVVTNYFVPNMEVDYSFQYRYRMRSISFLFYEEFICAVFVLLVFQYINYNYLTLFEDKVIKGTTHDTYRVPDDDNVIEAGAYSIDEQVWNVDQSKKEYARWDLINLVLSLALIFQFFLKLLFNSISKLKIRIDKWTIVDTLNGCINLIAMYVISNIDPRGYIEPMYKDRIDYYMIMVLCVAWIRFFAYFLAIRNISKLILTLLAMVADTLSFLFIMACFILIMASIFTTLYQDNNPAKYGGLGATIQTLFNNAMAVFSYEGMEGREISHSLLTIFTVFFANILLMNYLIAILSTTYEKMRESGIFKYKSNLYMYCDRFMVAFQDEAYGGLVMYPPPISYFVILMLPFSCSRTCMIQMQNMFSKTRFWIENLFLIITFICFEILIFPVAYVKTWQNLIKNSQGFGKTSLHLIGYLFTGFFIKFYLMMHDVALFFKLLLQY